MAFDLDDEELEATKKLHGVGKEEIQVGEYVRTKYGEIGIITQVYPQIKWIKKVNPSLLDYNIIKNHSFSIIDLIEVGDYVNGCKVYENHKTYLTVHQKVKDSEVDYNYINHDEIKSLVTKEQFAQMEYIVKE